MPNDHATLAEIRVPEISSTWTVSRFMLHEPERPFKTHSACGVVDHLCALEAPAAVHEDVGPYELVLDLVVRW